MATARYDEKYEGWICEYKNYRKQHTHRRIDSKFKVKDKEYPKLSKTKQAMKLAQMVAYAIKLEEDSKSGMIDYENLDKPINCADFLENLPDEKICESKNPSSIRTKRLVMERMITFLRNHNSYKKLFLHQMNNDVAREFFTSFNHYAYGSLDKMREALSFVFERNKEIMWQSGSNLRYSNPFRKESIIRGIVELTDERVLAASREIFTIEQVKQILELAPSFNEMLPKVWKLGLVLGWRLGDILRMKWEQIDFEQRTIYCLFQKTKNNQQPIEGKVFMTDFILEIIKSVPRLDNEFVFWGHITTLTNNIENQVSKWNRKILNILGLDGYQVVGVKKVYDFSFHCLRGTIITTLKNRNFNQDRIDFLVGHRGKGIDSKHYDKFFSNPREATEELINCMQSLLLQIKREEVLMNLLFYYQTPIREFSILYQSLLFVPNWTC